jgi:hypothetical protein
VLGGKKTQSGPEVRVGPKCFRRNRHFSRWQCKIFISQNVSLKNTVMLDTASFLSNPPSLDTVDYRLSFGKICDRKGIKPQDFGIDFKGCLQSLNSIASVQSPEFRDEIRGIDFFGLKPYRAVELVLQKFKANAHEIAGSDLSLNIMSDGKFSLQLERVIGHNYDPYRIITVSHLFKKKRTYRFKKALRTALNVLANQCGFMTALYFENYFEDVYLEYLYCLAEEDELEGYCAGKNELRYFKKSNKRLYEFIQRGCWKQPDMLLKEAQKADDENLRKWLLKVFDAANSGCSLSEVLEGNNEQMSDLFMIGWDYPDEYSFQKEYFEAKEQEGERLEVVMEAEIKADNPVSIQNVTKEWNKKDRALKLIEEIVEDFYGL